MVWIMQQTRLLFPQEQTTIANVCMVLLNPDDDAFTSLIG